MFISIIFQVFVITTVSTLVLLAFYKLLIKSDARRYAMHINEMRGYEVMNEDGTFKTSTEIDKSIAERDKSKSRYWEGI